MEPKGAEAVVLVLVLGVPMDETFRGQCPNVNLDLSINAKEVICFFVITS